MNFMAQYHPVKILYVEDDEAVRNVASEALREAGFEVIEAKTADEAIMLLTEPDDVGALFTDVRLPGSMDGIDLAHETRKAYPNMPVLVASGYSARITERLSDLSPPALFMTKPYSLSKLVSKMRGLTRGL